MLLLFRCLLTGESEGEELVVVRYMKYVPLLGKLEEALRCLCLQWATAGSAEKERDIEKEGGDGDVVVDGEWYGAVLF